MSRTVDRQAAMARREAAIAERIQPLPTDRKYGVVLADPPWQFKTHSDKGLGRSPEMHYPTMTLGDILAMPVGALAEKDSVLWLWVPIAHLRQGLDVMDAWGFHYKSNMVWTKHKFGTGFWFRGQHEHLLVGTRGKPVMPKRGLLVSSILPAPATKHSEKPEKFHRVIERYFPDAAKIELFARRRQPGWDAWGAEVDRPLLEDAR